MKLEDKFYSAFFYPFLIGITLSIIIVAIILSHYSTGYLDIRTSSDIYKLETNFARNNIYSANILLTNLLTKIQFVLQEQLNYFNLIANDLNNNSSKYNNNEKEIKDVYSVFHDPNEENLNNRMEYASLWFVDPETKHVNDSQILYNQIFIYSLLSQSLYTAISSMKNLISNIYFIFEDTNLFAVYPYKYYYDNDKIDSFPNYGKNPSWCTDNNGNIIEYYKFKCRDYYNDIMKAKKTIFDNNIEDQKNRKIFVTSPYPFFVESKKVSFTMCIEFNYTLSNTNAYICADINATDLFDSFDTINDKIIGYFSVNAVGFNNAFYFPYVAILGTGKTLGEYIFNSEVDFFLEEKINFLNVVQKQMTSNYYNNFNESYTQSFDKEQLNAFNEIFINNDNEGEDQYFFFDEEQYEYKIFPIILENYEGQKEHILSIIYIYKRDAFFEHLFDFEEGDYDQVPLQIILFVFFGFIYLYIIVLSFKILAKFIVIPIKNVHYMLEGINVGGEYRLEYLSNLKKKQEDNLEKLNKINQELSKKDKDNNNIDNFIQELYEDKDKDNININNSSFKAIKDNNNNLIDDKNVFVLNDDNNKINMNSHKNIGGNRLSRIDKGEDKLQSSTNEMNLYEEDNLDCLDYDGEVIDPKINYNKQYDLEGDKIEKELNFYGFDEELLQYRPVEIDRLVQSLLNLKRALLLTSSEQDVEQIIGYSNSEFIFSNFKNKEGIRMCQSNIGNLQSQLAKYDKAIYHLALSLENIELKKFLSQTLSDEFDDGDTLLHKIEQSYGKDIKGKELNKLVKKQQKSGTHKKVSQKLIEILINSRYNKLINFYFKFFSTIQKSDYNYEKLGGCFASTKFHTITNYHKILIQYIYLCFVSNDLVKIGESILDYIEFLIKFKLKATKENAYMLNINYKDDPEIRPIQLNKKKYFDKIINWFTLFDNYAKQINQNSALGNFKDVLDAYTHNIHSNQNDLDSGNQSALLFQINLQRCDFLKGKFALACEDYSDALSFLINAAKKKRIVVDGLIKKRALKHIIKITEKARKAIIYNNYSKLNYYEIFDKHKNNELGSKNSYINNNLDSMHDDGDEEEKKEKKEDNKKFMKLIDKMKELMTQVKDDINETNEKQLKDIIILIDCNFASKSIVDSYIDVVKTILKNYLTNNDRLGVFLLEKDYKIISPMAPKNEIDIINISKELDLSSENLFKKEKIEYTSLATDLHSKLIPDNMKGEHSISEKDSEEEDSISIEGFIEGKGLINDRGITIEDTVKSLNYCVRYLKMKEISSNEKFFIYFNSNMNALMDYMNENKPNDSNKKIKLVMDKKINFLLVGKINKEKVSLYNEILEEYFGNKSEIIPYDNMKKIKSILSSNNIINDDITFPNEIYK